MTQQSILPILGWLGIIALFVVAIRRPNSRSIWQYLFFLRVPILMGLLLIALPPIALFFLPAMLKNLFVLRSFWQLTFVVVSATMAAMAVVLVTNTLLANISARFEIPIPPWLSKESARPDTEPPIPELWQYILAFLLGAVTWITATYLSTLEELTVKETAIGLILGVSFSIALLFALRATREWLKSPKSPTWLKEGFINALSWLTRSRTQGYLENGELSRGHLSAIAFLVVALIVYLIVFVAYKPQPTPNQWEAPALLYLMLIILIVTLLFSGLTFNLDYFRIPVLVIFLIFSALSYGLFNIDHFYALNPLPQQTNINPNDFKTVIEQRLKNQKGEKTLVVVGASGGGIQAAGWTAKVLTGLQDSELLGTSFTQSIGLISSVSGGSVGMLYYLDRFGPNGYPESSELEPIFRSATQDSLDAVGWGLTYPDLWRVIGLPLLAPANQDRATAIDTDWQREMKEPQKTSSLATWREKIFQGEMPIPIFNATLVEDGRRFLISPMTFGEQLDKQFVDFNTLYGDYDLNVVTAARLSATFPYVSPLSRNPNQGQKIRRNYHVADGGYFDNSGFVTIEDWLNEWLAPEKNLKIERVLVLQINPFPKAPPQDRVDGSGGWFMATVGPLLTALKVRDPIMTARNATAVEIFRKRWENEVEIEYYPIYFPDAAAMDKVSQCYGSDRPSFYQENRYSPPLSWKLTTKERKAIACAWDVAKNKPNGSIQRLRKLWKEDWQM